MTTTERSDPLAEPTRRSFGLLLAGLRRRVGWTQEELAALWGKSTPTIKRIEAGKSQPDLDALRKLAELIGGASADLVALTDDLAQGLARAAADATIDITGPSATLADIVDLWMDGLEWTPTAAGARAPRLPRRGTTVTGDAEGDPEGTDGSDARPPAPTYTLSPPPLLFACEPRAHYYGEAGLAGHSLPEVDRPVSEARREGSARAARQELASRLITALMSGRAVVGARFPGALDAGALVAEVLFELTRDAGGALPALLVSDSPGIADAALARTGQLLPGLSRAAVRRSDEPPRVDLAIATSLTAAEWLRPRPPERASWRTIFVEGMDTARRLKLASRLASGYLGGVSVVVLADAIDVQQDRLKMLLGRAPDAEFSVGAAMLRGVLPVLRYHIVADPLDHDSIPRHIRWFHPGKAGAALSRDDRLEALVEAGALQPESNCLLHVVDQAQEDWAAGWLKRRLGREVEPALLPPEPGLRSSHPPAVPVEAEAPATQGAAPDDPASPAHGSTWICQRRQPRNSAVRQLDEVIFLDVGFSQHFLHQLDDALERARDGRELRAWDLAGRSVPTRNRTQALLGWLGASKDGETGQELVAQLVTMFGAGGSPGRVTSLDEVLALIAEGSAGG